MDQFPVGTVVWGRFGKTAWWPAIVTDRPPTRPGHVWLYWLSDDTRSQVQYSALEPFHRQLLRHMKPSIKPRMKKSIVRALQLLAERSGTDVSKYNNIEDWVLDPDGFFKTDNLQEMLLPVKEFSLLDVMKGSSNKRKYDSINDCTPVTKKDCTGCLCCHSNTDAEYKHPYFKGNVCAKCMDKLRKSLLSKDNDGTTLACVICGDLGLLVVCDNNTCGRSYCFDCMELFVGNKLAKKVQKEDWKCFICEDYDNSTHGSLIPREGIEINLVEFHQDLQLCKDLTYLTMAGKRSIRVLSLFDGISTGRYVLDELGLDVEVYYASEVDVDALKITNHNYKDDVVQLGDVMSLNEDRIAELCPLDLVLAGPPCNDLSIVNPKRKGFMGSALLLAKFIGVLRDIERLCKGGNHVFWMMESTANMLNRFKRDIHSLIGVKPAVWNSRDFTGQRRSRFFWGNIPGIYSTPDVLLCLEDEKQTLSSALTPNKNRTAVVEYTRTFTTHSNSYTINNGKNNKLVMMNGKEDDLWMEEMERLFGFRAHFTAVPGVSDNSRRKCLGKAWSVPVVKQILSPLKQYFTLTNEE